MITASVINDEARIKALNEEHKLEGFEYMATLDGGVEKAVAAVKTEGEILYMQLLYALEDDMAEMAIRSALAYGDNRYALTANTLDLSFGKDLQKVGFTEKDGVYSIEIRKVVHYCG